LDLDLDELDFGLDLNLDEALDETFDGLPRLTDGADFFGVAFFVFFFAIFFELTVGGANIRFLV
jgi:hypothetical protein